MAWRVQNAFTGGEISPRLYGRFDLDVYAQALAELTNFTLHVHGGASRRSGLVYGWEVKDSSKATRILPYERSVADSYIIELGDQYMRFAQDGALIESAPSTPVELSTSYLEAELFDILFCQIGSVMWLVHPNHRPRKLFVNPSDNTDWTLVDETFSDGPYLPLNATSTTFTPSGAGPGTVTVTASAVTGINGDQGFLSTDVGRLIRIDNGTDWAWGEITVVTDTTHVSVLIESVEPFPATATADWRLGLWSVTTGYPAAVTVYEERLTYGGGVESFPGKVSGSETDQYGSFKVSTEVVASDAISYTIASDRLDAIQWLLGGEQLNIGTSGSEWVMSGGDAPLAPDSVRAKQQTTVGGKVHKPISIDGVTLFVPRSGRGLHEYAFVFENDRNKSPDMALRAEHLLRGTNKFIVDLDFSPDHKIIWAVRADGRLLGLTYSRDEQVVGWHTHTTGASGLFESVCNIPENTTDTTYVVVQRTVDGSQVRYVEYLDIEFNGEDVVDAFFTDSGIKYDGVATTTISGLDHLEGESVIALADGIAIPAQTVVSGDITLPDEATQVQAGLPFLSRLKTLPLEVQAQDGSSMGRQKTIAKAVVKFSESYGGRMGIDEISNITWNEALVYGAAPELFNGEKEEDVDGGSDVTQQLTIEQDLPFPMTINALTQLYGVTSS